MPLLPILGLLLAVPLIEVWLFIEVGGTIGASWTILACIATAAAGAALVRFQGLSVMASARTEMQAGRVPAAEAFDGVCLLLAGALLLTPGFFTDTLGFLLLVPRLRHGLRAWLARRVEVAGVRVRSGRTDGRVVEGEWEVVEDPARPPRDQDDPRLLR